MDIDYRTGVLPICEEPVTQMSQKFNIVTYR